MFKKLRERIEYLEKSGFQDSHIMLKMTNQINENERVSFEKTLIYYWTT